MLKSVNLKRFKKFKDTTIELKPFTILMGENSSGKTTILKALNLTLSTFAKTDLYTIKENGDVKIRPKGIGMTELVGMDIADYRELYYAKSSRNGQRVAGENNTKIGTVINVVDSLENQYRLQISSLFGGYNLKCLSKPDELSNKPTFCKYAPLYISGFVGLRSSEERSFPVAIKHKLSTGDASTVIRNVLLDLKESQPEKYQLLCTRLEKDFGFHLADISFNRQTDQYVTAHFSDNCESKKLSLDFNSSGSGFMQVLQILTPIYSFCPDESRVVLLDEPDAHLHPNLQTSLAKSLRRAQKELGIQIIISTHSTSIIRSAKATEVVPVSSKQAVNSPLTNSDEVEQLITELDTYELGKSIISGKLIFIEDSNIAVYEAFDRVKGICSLTGVNTVPVITGRGKDDKIPFQIREVFKIYLNKTIDIYFVRDGDGMTHEWREKLNTYAANKDVNMYQLERYEIENYILEPKIIYRAVKEKYPNKDIPPIDDIIDKIKNILSDTISKSRYGYDDNLEDSIYKTANLLGDGAYRNSNMTKHAADAIREQYETYSTLDELLVVGMGKEGLKQILGWLNSLGLNLSKTDIIDAILPEDVPEEITMILSNFKSVISLNVELDELPEIEIEDDEIDIEEENDTAVLDGQLTF